MIDLRDRKDLIVILIVAVILILGLTIFSLVMIWKPAKEKEEEFEVGKYNYESKSDEEILEDYIDEIGAYLRDGDYNSLYSIVGTDYSLYTNLTVNSLKEKCEKLKISGQEIYLESYEIKEINGLNKLYFAVVRGKVSNISTMIVIREYSPKNYSITFDNFVARYGNNSNKTAENVRLLVEYEYYTTTQAEYKVKITNANSNSIYINSNEYADGVYLGFTSDKITPVNSVTAYKKKELKSGESIHLTLKFNMEGKKYSDINSIILRDVKIDDNRVVNLQYDIKASIQEYVL